MYEKLIEQLREYPDREETAGGYVEIDWQDLLDAADAIESLTTQLSALQTANAEKDKEIERLTTELKLWREQAKTEHRDKEMYNGMRLKAKAVLSRVEAERDAAISDISHICATCDQFEDGMCLVLFYKDYPKDCEHWKWRGVQGEG